MEDNRNGWSEWSKYVLKELEKLNKNYESILFNFNDLKIEVTKLHILQEDVKNTKDQIYSYIEKSSKLYKEDIEKTQKAYKDSIDDIRIAIDKDIEHVEKQIQDHKIEFEKYKVSVEKQLQNNSTDTQEISFFKHYATGAVIAGITIINILILLLPYLKNIL